MPTERILPALALRLIAILCMSTMGALIKLAEAHGAHVAEALFFRQLFALPIVLAFVAAAPGGLRSIQTRRLGAHRVRTLIGLAAMVLNFLTVILLPLAEATTLSFTVPIFATILGATLLGEPTGWHRWGAVIIGFIGVLIVARPEGGSLPPIGALAGLLGAIFVAFAAIQIRQLGRTESAGTTVFWFSLLSLPPLGLAYALTARWHDPAVFALLTAIGLIGGIGQLASTGSLRFAPVSAVVAMDYSSLLWSTLYGWLIFSVLPSESTWIGAPIIVASGLYIAWREHRLRRQSTPAILD